MKKNDIYKSGTWGKSDKEGFSLLPLQVKESVLDMIDGKEDTDWEYFATGGSTWFVAKLWDEDTFEVVASVVKYISSPLQGKSE